MWNGITPTSTRLLRAATIMSAALLMIGCASPNRPPEVPYTDPVVSASGDWAATFAKPVDIEVHPLYTGTIQVKRSLLLEIENPAIEDHEDRKLWVPVMAYLVRHPEKGDVLIDSGLDSSFATRRGGNFGRAARLVKVFDQEAGQDTVSRLRALGVEPEQLRMIFLSHLHLDHTAGLPDIPKSVRLVAGPRAMDGYENPFLAPVDHLAGFNQIEALDFTDVEENELGKVIDVYGDGSFFVISAPGHVSGNLSFLINRTSGPLLLTCDASHTREGLLNGVGPGKIVDREAADKTVQRLSAFIQAHPEVSFKAGHDALDWEDLMIESRAE